MAQSQKYYTSEAHFYTTVMQNHYSRTSLRNKDNLPGAEADCVKGKHKWQLNMALFLGL
jgi:hypothetical protein